MADENLSRRLATIVALDVAGYSARTEADELKATSEVVALREAIERIAKVHGGRVFNSAGDGFMLEFGSSLAAVEAACELAEQCQPSVRVGVHLGDVVVQQNGDLLGHGVNVAARLMAHSNPGSALLSADVRHTIRGPIAERFVSRGALRLDKMAETVEAFDLVVATALKVSEASAQEGSFESPPLPINPSLAVLPFSNLSSASDQDYFIEGMMDEIVTSLTRIRSLFVIASRSTMALKGYELTPEAAARRLGVRYILEGSVRRAGPKIRIAVILTDAREGGQIWAERFEGTLEDVFALQDHVALSVAGVIEPTVHAAEARRITRRPLESLGAYDLYLRAAALRATLRKAEVIEALGLLQRALEMAPTFAPALAQAAGCHSQVFVNAWSDDPETHRRAALVMAERAIECGADDPSVLAQSANAIMELDNALDRAALLIDRATTLNPGSAYAWLISGFIRLVQGDGETSIEHFERAARLDPVSRSNEIARTHIGIAHAMLGNYAEALRLIRGTSHRPARVRLVLAVVYALLNMSAEAARELQLYDEVSNVPAEDMASMMGGGSEFKNRMAEGIARARISTGAARQPG